MLITRFDGFDWTVMFRIVEDEMPPLPDDCSDALQDFLQQCFYKDPLQRPDAERLCEHPWLKINWDALKVRPSLWSKGLTNLPTRNSVLRIVSLSYVASVPTFKKQTLPKCWPMSTRPSWKRHRQSLLQERSRVIHNRTPTSDRHHLSLMIHLSRLEIIPL